MRSKKQWAACAMLAGMAMSSANALAATEAALPASGQTCRFECADGTHGCSKPGDLVTVCETAPLWTDKGLAEFVGAFGLVGRPFREVQARLQPLNFSCTREYHRTGHDMGCTRTVSMPHCMLRIQSVWFNLRELDHGEPRPVADDEAVDLSKETPFSGMHVSRVTTRAGGTGDDACRGGR